MMILTLYCGMYSLACVTKHFDLYWALMIGRLLGGVATSVLFSCFESWAVAEHARLGLRPAALKQLRNLTLALALALALTRRSQAAA
jgi:hypothetical protein